MKVKELHSMSEGELKDKLEEAKKELMRVNAQIASGTTPKSPGQAKQLKKTVARIYTILKEKQIKDQKVKTEGKKV